MARAIRPVAGPADAPNRCGEDAVKAYGRKILARFPAVRAAVKAYGTPLIPDDVEAVLVCRFSDLFLHAKPQIFFRGSVEKEITREELFLLDGEGWILARPEPESIMLGKGDPRVVAEGESVIFAILKVGDPERVKYGVMVTWEEGQSPWVTIYKPPRPGWITSRLKSLGAEQASEGEG